MALHKRSQEAINDSIANQEVFGGINEFSWTPYLI